MKKLSLLALALSASACAQRYDVNVSWTVDGSPASEACQQLTSPNVTLRLEQQESENGPVIEETSTAACADGDKGVTVHSAGFSTLFVDVTAGDPAETYGSSGPITLAPATAAGAYAGSQTDAPVLADVGLEKGRLHSRLTVVGKNCGDVAGADTFSVTLRRNTAPGAEEIVKDGVTVTCNSDGFAFFDFEPLVIGSTYDIVATAAINGTPFATADDGVGHGFVAEGALTDTVTDLDATRP